jgi:hypothetical protein
MQRSFFWHVFMPVLVTLSLSTAPALALGSGGKGKGGSKSGGTHHGGGMKSGGTKSTNSGGVATGGDITSGGTTNACPASKVTWPASAVAHWNQCNRYPTNVREECGSKTDYNFAKCPEACKKVIYDKQMVQNLEINTPVSKMHIDRTNVYFWSMGNAYGIILEAPTFADGSTCTPMAKPSCTLPICGYWGQPAFP